MFWRFCSGLSLKVIDHLLEFVSPKDGAMPPATSKNDTASTMAPFTLESMMERIASDMQMLEEMQHVEWKAELASRAREKFTGNISHDLRTPLNAIIGFTQMMESGIFGPIGNPQYLEYLRHIRESGYELLERIDDLLETTRETVQERPEPLKEAI
jgi:signal transduction histidine kinase